MKTKRGDNLFSIALAVLVALSIAFVIFGYPYKSTPEWFGIKKDSEKTTTVKVFKTCKKGTLKQDEGKSDLDPESVQCDTATVDSKGNKFDSKGNTIRGNELENVEISVTSKEQSPKTFWDLLNLFATLGIPLAVYVFQRSDQRKSNDRLDAEAKANEDNLCEAALQSYIDRISEALVVKDRKERIFSPKQDECDELDVVRIRTVTTLRRLEDNHEKYYRVFEFLQDANLLSVIFKNAKNLKNIRFSYADLSNTDFSGSDLNESNFLEANLTKATFTQTKLQSADFRKARLQSAVLVKANLRFADFTGADLTATQLLGADLYQAKLLGVTGLTMPQIEQAENWDKAFYNRAFQDTDEFQQALVDLNLNRQNSNF